ncbi:sulfiredoxin, chloroplastic/mitochondrial-like [Rosa chinensis]|uniref:sulfiredoxin, chloroplastic/mitochondrial-like n=1 Tax=Rosa chinensis TaxID=74649 RepID=UPI001AD8CAB5|nr:sulfiredoxin, chloroplastic/mitochondrial-like [Rosa chinensis]
MKFSEIRLINSPEWMQVSSSKTCKLLKSISRLKAFEIRLINSVMELQNICNHPYFSQLHVEEYNEVDGGNFLRSFTISASASSNGSPPLSSSGSSGGGGGPVILELPVDKIRRPLMRTRTNDPVKVQELMDSISEIGVQVPIDVLEVDGVYYGCNRSANSRS